MADNGNDETMASDDRYGGKGVGHRPKPESQSANADLVYEWVMAYQNHDRSKLEELMGPSAEFVFEDEDGEPVYFLMKDLLDVASNFWEGFPDGGCGWDSIKQTSANVVVVSNFRWFGHHTGVPYKFEPYPEIEAKGTYVTDGHIRMTFQIEGGKVVSAKSKGKNQGPHGLYVALGGIIL